MKVMIITGASSGIGRALYSHFSGRGYKVLGVSLNGPDVFVDLCKPFSFPIPATVHVLINCAGIMPFDESPEVMDTNFWGTLNMIKSVIPSMKERGGCIINIASISGMMADPDLPIYAASKAAVISLTKSLAKKYAPGIRVNSISPGFHTTNLAQGPTPQELINTIPMGYENKPEGLIEPVEVLLKNEYMTGTNIVIDGGVLL